MLRINSSVALLATLVSSSYLFAESPLQGISKEKPTSGPSVQVEQGFMVPYMVTIPGTEVSFEMIPIPGGTFLLGSPEEEPGRSDDEGPQVSVTVDPMWVAKTEVTWAQYKPFMQLYGIFKEFESQGKRVVTDENRVDAITAPTELYDPTFTFEFGEGPSQPAVTMTQYAAQQFTKWLSRTTGEQFRLPTEAEWEYAARGGSSTAYGFDQSAEELGDYAWYFDNADAASPEVGTKKPNAFGLHDMHGSVAELTINQYTEDGYASFQGKSAPLRAFDVVVWPESASPIVARGGSWEMDADRLRSAARLASDDEAWKEEDPNFPRSPWWFTSDPSRGVGFRLFRSYKPMQPDMISKFWDPVAEDVINDVNSRIVGGRGGWGIVDPELPAAIQQLKK
jgi:formylglycine-generating enzyme required for sulfatase activity